MLRTFNYGAGFAVFLPDKTNSELTVNIARQLGYEAIEAGEVLPSQSGRQLIIEPFNVKLKDEDFLLQKS